MKLSVRVTPRASKDSVGTFDASGTLAVRVTPPPADGAANDAVVKLLAKTFGLAQRDVVLVSGATSRTKVFELPLTPGEIAGRLQADSPKP
jgi:uncharacterized protein (TIGR00251 family)